MSESQWNWEEETGRWYIPKPNEYGEEKRWYEEDLDRSPSTSHQPAAQPSRRDRHETPRSESASRNPKRTVSYVESSSKHSNSGRRGSGATKRPEVIAELRKSQDKEASRPIAISRQSSSRYHDDGGYSSRHRVGEPHQDGSMNVSRETRDYQPAQASESTRFHTGHSLDQYSNERPGFSGVDWQPNLGTDGLTGRLGALTMAEVAGHPEYKVSSSLPLTRNSWNTVPGVAQKETDHGYEYRRHDSLTSHDMPTIYSHPSDNVPDLAAPYAQGSLYEMRSIAEVPDQGKGKGIARDQHETLPSQLATKSHVIEGTPRKGQTERLDSDYKIRNFDFETFFKPGRVFKTLWTDAYAGKTNKNNGSEANQFMSVVKYGEKVFSKIRRFVVVRQGDRFCTCLPVTTYDGRGYKKSGIILNHHGLIYTSDRTPKPVAGISKEPLKLLISSEKGAERLVNPSYINYARVYTVELNVKVKDCGELETSSRRLLRHYFNQVNIMSADDELEGPMPIHTRESREQEFAGAGGGVGFAPNYLGQQGYGVGAYQSSTQQSTNYETLGYGPVHSHQENQWTRNSNISTSQSQYDNSTGYFQHGNPVPGPTYSNHPLHSPQPTFFSEFSNPGHLAASQGQALQSDQGGSLYPAAGPSRFDHHHRDQEPWPNTSVATNPSIMSSASVSGVRDYNVTSSYQPTSGQGYPQAEHSVRRSSNNEPVIELPSLEEVRASKPPRVTPAARSSRYGGRRDHEDRNRGSTRGEMSRERERHSNSGEKTRHGEKSPSRKRDHRSHDRDGR